MLSAPRSRVDAAVDEGKGAPRNNSALVRDATAVVEGFLQPRHIGIGKPHRDLVAW